MCGFVVNDLVCNDSHSQTNVNSCEDHRLCIADSFEFHDVSFLLGMAIELDCLIYGFCNAWHAGVGEVIHQKWQLFIACVVTVGD